MMKIIQFQNRIQAFWWEGIELLWPFLFLFNPMVKTMGEIWAVRYADWEVVRLIVIKKIVLSILS
jgi:hypothetical protein